MVVDFIVALTATLLALLAVIYMVYPSILRDVYTIRVMSKLVRLVKDDCMKKKLVIDSFEEKVKQHPEKTFIVFQDQHLSYKEVDNQANRAAHVLTSLGLRAGETLAIVMSNEPAFIWLFLGVQKIGARAALVNHHLKAEGLRSSIVGCHPKLVIVGDGLDDYLPSRVARLSPGVSVPVYSYNPPPDPDQGACLSPDLPCFSSLMSQTSSRAIFPGARTDVKLSEPAVFIFTSGTTGFPKPAIISHKKTIVASHSYGPAGFTSGEVMYLCLPLYHASALTLALLNVISVGATLVLREKFSASQFWPDCVRHRVTCVQYIGEMLRYLVNSPHRPEETEHKVWAAVGNGLRADIWDEFKRRFGVKHIYEFYGSTEGPATVINLFNIPGSVGRLSPLLSRLMNIILVKLDEESQKPYRNANGRCELIAPGSQGVMLVKLTPQVQFDGYLGPAADTRSRILQDVLEPGDFYVNCSDVFALDKSYNLYFRDRIGDSYRWKGENVSTAEVSTVMNTASFVHDTNVFGVKVPGYEGKAGMAAINLKEEENVDPDKLHELSKLCRSKLPGYARPRFLRFQRQMSLTTTFKQQKTDLAKEGFDPQVVNEPLFYLDRKMDEFKPLDEDAFKGIVLGEIAL